VAGVGDGASGAATRRAGAATRSCGLAWRQRRTCHVEAAVSLAMDGKGRQEVEQGGLCEGRDVAEEILRA
jgi:hypothetical protein